MQPHTKTSNKLQVSEHRVCPECLHAMETLHNTVYCPSCRKCPTLMDNSIKQPNYNFKLHFQEHRVQAAYKIQTHARDLLCRLDMRVSTAEVDDIVAQVLAMHRSRGVNKKGYREETAAVVFALLEDQIRMTVYQFCSATGLQRKKFNRMYLKYREIQKQQLIQRQQLVQLKTIKKEEEQEQQANDSPLEMPQLKRQQENSEDSEQDEEQVSRTVESNQQIQPNISGAFNEEETRILLTKTIQKLYIKLFPQPHFFKHRPHLINSIVEKCLGLWVQATGAGFLKKYFKAPCMIYNVLKLNGYRVAKRKYIEIVEKELQVRITDRMINKCAPMPPGSSDKLEEEEEGSSPTSQSLQQ